MPTPTFFNLPADKRERITELAIEEFAGRPYHRASLSRLVARAGIAKGSVYQYFEDKLDLYRWLLLEELPRRKLAYLRTAVTERPPTTLREVLAHAVRSGLRFVVDDPRVSQLGAAVGMPTDDPQLRALYAQVRREGHERFTELLRGLVAAGQLRDDVAPELVAHLITAVLGTGLRDIVLGQLGVDLFDLLDDPSLASRLSEPELQRLVDDILSLLLDGLRPS